jgi:hypothetical protein
MLKVGFMVFALSNCCRNHDAAPRRKDRGLYQISTLYWRHFVEIQQEIEGAVANWKIRLHKMKPKEFKRVW